MQTVTKHNIFKNSIAHVGKITNLVQRGKGKGARVHARGSAHGRASPSPPLITHSENNQMFSWRGNTPQKKP